MYTHESAMSVFLDAARHDPPEAKRLLDSGIFKNASEKSEALHYVATWGGDTNKRTFGMLLEHGASLDMVFTHGSHDLRFGTSYQRVSDWAKEHYKNRPEMAGKIRQWELDAHMKESRLAPVTDGGKWDGDAWKRKASKEVSRGSKFATKVLSRFGGAAGGVAAGGITLAATGSITEASAAAIPGGQSVKATYEGRTAEAVISGIEEVPLAGGLVGEAIRGVNDMAKASGAKGINADSSLTKTVVDAVSRNPPPGPKR
jgi:hypothetical protein